MSTRWLVRGGPPEAWAKKCADLIASYLQRTVSARGQATLALSGGSTPKRVFHELKGRPLPWSSLDVFWSDERAVPLSHPDSNAGMAEAALEPVIGQANIHRMPGEAPNLDAAAEAYEQALAKFDHELDLVLLGLGNDGHTASLFPNTPALLEQNRWVVANAVTTQSLASQNTTATTTQRLTLTFRTLNAARRVMFLVQGEDKAGILQTVLESPAAQLPAQRVQANEVVWVVDSAASRQLSPATLASMGDGRDLGNL